MLRSVHLSNFVRFHEEEKLDFNEDTYFFVGKNGSGKSTIFEAIRRCMSSKVSSSYSNIGVEGKDTYVVCSFDVTNTDAHPGGVTKIFSCLFHLAHDKPDTNYKLAFAVNEQSLDDRKFGLERIDKTKKCHPIQIQKQCAEDILRKLQTNSNSGINDVIGIIKQQKDQPPDESVQISGCDVVLKPLDEKVVCLFEKRGVTPLHWSFSEKNKDLWRNQERDEIISWWYNSKDKSKDDEEREAEIFETITNSRDFKFYIEDGNIMVEERGFTWNFLKTPGGLVEAKECSIILACSNLQTLCLEEPTRSMHPQMIQRFRDYILPDIQKKGKVVLIATHNPLLITASSVLNTFLFRKRVREDGITCTVISGSNLSPEMKAKKTLTDSHISKLFFSSRVIFVEGENDRIFIKTLFSSIVKGSDNFQRVFGMAQRNQGKLNGESSSFEHVHKGKRKLSDSDHMGEFSRHSLAYKNNGTEKQLSDLKRFIKGMDVIQMDGSTKVKVLNDVCKTLELRRYFLLDRDVLFDKRDSQSEEELKKPAKIKELFGVETSSSDLPTIRKELRTHGVFLWKHGALEDMVNKLIDTNTVYDEPDPSKRRKRQKSESKSTEDGITQEERRRKVEENLEKIENGKLSGEDTLDFFDQENINVQLTGRKSRKKLFGSEKLTDENIQNGINIILALCHTREDDLVQFIQFLSDMQAIRINAFTQK